MNRFSCNRKTGLLKNLSTAAVAGFALGLLLVLISACKAPDKGYDLYIYTNENTAQFDAICKAYTVQTGIRVKIGVPVHGKDYTRELITELNFKSRPVVFSVLNFENMDALREEGFIQDLSQAEDSIFADMVSKIPEPLQLGREGNFGVPSAVGAYGYLVDRRMISALFGEGNEDAAIAALKTASYDEWAELIRLIDRWAGYAFPYRLFLSGRVFALTGIKADLALNLNGVFALSGGRYLVDSALNAAFNEVPELLFETDVRPVFVDFARALDMESTFPAGLDGPIRRTSFPPGGFEQTLKIFSQGKAVFLGADTGVYESLIVLNPSMAAHLILLPAKIPFRNAIWYSGLSYARAAQINRSIAVYPSSFHAVNALASPEEKKKAYEFLVWLNTTGRDYYKEKPAFVFNAVNDYIQTGNIIASPLPGPFGVSFERKLEEEYFKKLYWTEADYEAIANYIIDVMRYK